MTISTPWGRDNLGEMITRPGWFCVSTFFVLLPHIVAVSSVFLRWGGIPAGMAVTIGLFFLTLSTAVHGPDAYVGAPIGLFYLFACVGCHFVVLHRIRMIASR